MGDNVTVENNMEAFDALYEKCALKALLMIGGYAETAVKEKLTENGSVDTGLLRNSITYAVAGQPPAVSGYTSDDGEKSGSYAGEAPADENPKEKSVYIGTNVEYAPYVELGHHQQPGRFVPKLGKRLVASFVAAKPYLRPGVQGASEAFEDIIALCFEELNQTE